MRESKARSEFQKQLGFMAHVLRRAQLNTLPQARFPKERFMLGGEIFWNSADVHA